MEDIIQETEIPLSRIHNSIILNIQAWTRNKSQTLQTSQNKYESTYIPRGIKKKSFIPDIHRYSRMDQNVKMKLCNSV